MSSVHIEKFAAIVASDAGLFAKLGVEKASTDAAAAQASMAAFIAKSVQEGKALGFEFTEAEARVWLNEQIKAEVSGELSDTQLEAVAGGKGQSNNERNHGGGTMNSLFPNSYGLFS